ncbi:unnamed protein product [Caenorhabditis bovis]|uniref:Uncharacterized protein n=1 Tax=Caenorhabditis bovis TaxID=2654633 RepID=A0A8S1EJM2_9PELO|nr:unnamed protein product [Caenorhabditis bovis]
MNFYTVCVLAILAVAVMAAPQHIIEKTTIIRGGGGFGGRGGFGGGPGQFGPRGGGPGFGGRGGFGGPGYGPGFGGPRYGPGGFGRGPTTIIKETVVRG